MTAPLRSCAVYVQAHTVSDRVCAALYCMMQRFSNPRTGGSRLPPTSVPSHSHHTGSPLFLHAPVRRPSLICYFLFRRLTTAARPAAYLFQLPARGGSPDPPALRDDMSPPTRPRYVFLRHIPSWETRFATPIWHTASAAGVTTRIPTLNNNCNAAGCCPCSSALSARAAAQGSLSLSQPVCAPVLSWPMRGLHPTTLTHEPPSPIHPQTEPRPPARARSRGRGQLPLRLPAGSALSLGIAGHRALIPSVHSPPIMSPDDPTSNLAPRTLHLPS